MVRRHGGAAMTTYPKVWAVRDEDGRFVDVNDSPCGWVFPGWTDTECVAVPVEEWTRVQRLEAWLRGGVDGMENRDRWICTPFGEHGPVVARSYDEHDIEAPSLLELARALDTTTPTTEAK